MTERGDKLRRSLSLSKSKRKGTVKAGTSANAGANTTPITSFFNSQPPPKLACPLCGLLVPRFRINEHIDLQCQNFERGDDNTAASTSEIVLPSVRPLSPRGNPPKSPEAGPGKEEEDDKEQTSPYFKKNASVHQTPREISRKSVVRVIDLGSLSSKLSRNCQKRPEGTQAGDKHEPTYSEALSSSQKENVEIEGLEDMEDFVTTSADASSAAEELRSKSKTVKKLVTPKLQPSSKLSKRKKETPSSGRGFGLGKKAKYDGRRSRDVEEDVSSVDVAETTSTDASSVTTSTCDAPLSPDETFEESAAVISGDTQSNAESTAGDQAVADSHPQQLPYYLRNFQTVLQAVLENEDDRALFDQHDMSHIHAFEKLSGMLKYHPVIVIMNIASSLSCVFFSSYEVMGQKLYVRLFQRKLKWLQVSKLDYQEICSDLEPVAQELVQGGFLQSGKSAPNGHFGEF